MKMIRSFTTTVLLSATMILSARADHSCDNDRRLSGLLNSVERSTDALLENFKDELVHRDLWKPRGPYAELYAVIRGLENGADSLRKARSFGSVYRISCNLVAYADRAREYSRYARMSRGFHSDLSAAVNSVSALASYSRNAAGSDGYGRGRGYGEDRYDRRGRGGEGYGDRRGYSYRESSERGYSYGRNNRAERDYSFHSETEWDDRGRW